MANAKEPDHEDLGSLIELQDALAALKNSEEVLAFAQDLCTPSEWRAMSERWRAVQLVQKEVPYRRICELTGVSTATVTRVARALNEGTGYRTILTRLLRRRS
ncbi:MAG: transposase [Proteobacteria bacterium]|nr:MAG: transposase [Pseudomonadota bacterium]